MQVAIVYYSRTGRTRYVALRIGEELRKSGVSVDVYEVKQVREYSSRLMHLNPRLIYDTLTGRLVDIVGIEDLNPGEYDLLVVGSPIWFGTVAPAIRSFIKIFMGMVKNPVACFVTSNLRRKYSLKFKKVLEEYGYKVLLHETINDINDENTIRKFVEEVLKIISTKPAESRR